MSLERNISLCEKSELEAKAKKFARLVDSGKKSKAKKYFEELNEKERDYIGKERRFNYLLRSIQLGGF